MVKIPGYQGLFPSVKDFDHAAIFTGCERAWDALAKIEGYISGYISALEDTPIPEGLEIQSGHESYLFCSSPLRLERDFYSSSLKILIRSGTRIETTAIIKGPAIIGKNCDIRQGAYLRGYLIAGDTCTLGHTTEIKGSIIMNHSEMGHFNYIGDSVIGSFVNIGAGTKLANLKFRSPSEKENVNFPEISFVAKDPENGKSEIVMTGLSKFGAVLGDYCELGCNSVLSPAVILGTECWVYPNFTVPSGYYDAKSFIAPATLKAKTRPLPHSSR
ncbi:MAG: hypothetical protein OEY64_05295 [Nitrospinota bacterium]|nr:hypothetical protein [Nitrospinota bacterium]